MISDSSHALGVVSLPQNRLQRLGRRHASAQNEVGQRQHDVQVLVGPLVVLEMMLVQEREPPRTLKPAVVGHVHAVVQVLIAGLVQRESCKYPRRYR